MAHYVLLLRLTAEGASQLEMPSDYMQTIMDAWGLIGGSCQVLMTMGDYDFVITGEAEKDEQVTWLVAQLAKDRWIQPVTLRAFDREEAYRIFAEPPASAMKIKLAPS